MAASCFFVFLEIGMKWDMSVESTRRCGLRIHIRCVAFCGLSSEVQSSLVLYSRSRVPLSSRSKFNSDDVAKHVTLTQVRTTGRVDPLAQQRRNIRTAGKKYPKMHALTYKPNWSRIQKSSRTSELF